MLSMFLERRACQKTNSNAYGISGHAAICGQQCADQNYFGCSCTPQNTLLYVLRRAPGMSKRAGKGGGDKQRADLCHCLSKMLRCTFCNIISSGSVCSTLVLLDRSKVQPGKLPPLLLSDVTRCASVELVACPLSSVNRATWGSLSHATNALFSILCLSAVCLLSCACGVYI